MDEHNSNVTIYDIAKKANVSAATVSRVINNKDNVRKSTRQKIEKLLAEYHYSPNEAARGLANQDSKFIGILVDDIRTTHHTEGIFYLQQEFLKLGYCCIVLSTGNGDDSKAAYIQLLKQRRVEAAVLIGSVFQNERVRQAIVEYLPQTPIVICNGYLDLPNVCGIIADEEHGIQECVELLGRKGKRHPAFMLEAATPSNLLKQKGYLQGIAELPDAQPMVVRCENTMESAYQATLRLLEEHPETDSIIYSVDLLAVGGVKAAVYLKKKIPEELALIGVDNSVYSQLSTPTLTTLDNMLFDMSVAAARNLIDSLRDNYVPKKMMVFSRIVERETT